MLVLVGGDRACTCRRALLADRCSQPRFFIAALFGRCDRVLRSIRARPHCSGGFDVDGRLAGRWVAMAARPAPYGRISVALAGKRAWRRAFDTRGVVLVLLVLRHPDQRSRPPEWPWKLRTPIAIFTMVFALVSAGHQSLGFGSPRATAWASNARRQARLPVRATARQARRAPMQNVKRCCDNTSHCRRWQLYARRQ
jgi:hypothetical protein